MPSHRRDSKIKSVTERLASKIGRMVRNISYDYPGGNEKLEIIKKHPDFKQRLYQWFDSMAFERKAKLPLNQHPAFKTIEIGTRTSMDALNKELLSKGLQISELANEILRNQTVALNLTSIRLLKISVGELGFISGTFEEIIKNLISRRLRQCTAEDAIQLRLKYPDQPNGERILVAMEPIQISDDQLAILSVDNIDKELWLNGYRIRFDSILESSDQLICRFK